MAGFYQSKPLSYAMIFAKLILLPFAILLSQIGYSWEGPLETTLSNPLTQGEPLRASSPRTMCTVSEYSQGAYSLSKLSQCLVILTDKMCFMVFRGNLLCFFVLVASGPVCEHHWKESVSLLFAPSIQIFIHFDVIPLPWAFSGSPVRRNDPVSVSSPSLFDSLQYVSKWRAGFCSFFSNKT